MSLLGATARASRFTEADALALHRQYEQGSTLSQLASQTDVTRETIRQLFLRYQLPIRSAAEAAELESSRRAAIAEQHREEIQRLYMQYGTIDQVAAHFDVPRKLVANIIAQIPNRESYRRTQDHAVYSREELIAHLQRAARVKGEPLGIPTYRQAARELGLANYDTQVRFFSLEDPENPWLTALDAAGVQGHAPLGRRLSSISPTDCVDAVERCLREHPDGVSYARYLEWAKSNSAPSGPSVRKIVGWGAALELAYERLTDGTQ